MRDKYVVNDILMLSRIKNKTMLHYCDTIPVSSVD